MPREREAEGGSVFDYLAHEFDPVSQRPLGDVDSLVLACLSYYHVPGLDPRACGHEGVPLRDLFRADWFEPLTRGLWDPEGLVRLLGAVVASPRLHGLVISDCVEELDATAEKQFSACTVRFPSGDAYVSFGGTDNTLVGWKEDLNMAFETDVASQRAAVSYLQEVAPTIPGAIYLGGHSKGGNLAVYALCTCDPSVSVRVRRAFSHDGPGFSSQTQALPQWVDRAALISKTVPESSMIGMLFEEQEEYEVVASSSWGIMQHDPFSWVVDGRDFVRREHISRGAGYLDKTLNRWVASMEPEERGKAINAFFSVLFASGRTTFADLSANLPEALPAMLEEARSLDPDQRDHILQALSSLLRVLVPDVGLPSLSGVQESAVRGIRRGLGALGEARHAIPGRRRLAGGDDDGGGGLP